MKVFDAVMAERSITRAATRLCVSQPAISNALSRLRKLYDDPLFVRSAKGVIPTPKACEVAISIRTAIQTIEETLEASEFRAETSHRKFTVALTDYGELYFLPHIMRRLNSDAPGIEVVCLPQPGATMAPEMKSGSVDLVWDWKKVDDPDFRADLVFEDRSYCIARHKHPYIESQITLQQFLELEHVVLRPTRSHVPMIERKLENLGLERKVVLEVSHVLVLASIVASTNLVACMPERLARLYARQLNVQLFPNPVFDDPVSVYQIWHRHFDEDAGHAWFRQLLTDIASQDYAN
ncbi:MAG: LysR family transcriptional regulator [Gammaproteobacteria bacterium]|nr:LysR family transcriptional regulator [Gammaproteobacteria bacterium]